MERPDFEIYAQGMTEKRRQADIDDLGNETAGRETGRMLRFSLANTHHIQEEKRKREEAYDNLLQQMLQNADYAKLYYETQEILICAETLTGQVLEQIEQSLRQEQETLRQMEKSANRISNGKMVFRDAQGNVRNENGTIISADEATSIVWRNNSPSYEEFHAQQEKLVELRRSEEELRHYQVDVLGNARDRITDEQNPPSTDELNKIKQRIIDEALPEIRPKLEQSPASDHAAYIR